jgi:hypothetical protein
MIRDRDPAHQNGSRHKQDNIRNAARYFMLFQHAWNPTFDITWTCIFSCQQTLAYPWSHGSVAVCIVAINRSQGICCHMQHLQECWLPDLEPIIALRVWRYSFAPLLAISGDNADITISFTGQITYSLTLIYNWPWIRLVSGLVNDARPRAAKQARRRTGSASPPTQKTSLHRPLEPRRTRLEALQFIQKVTTNARALSFCLLGRSP